MEEFPQREWQADCRKLAFILRYGLIRMMRFKFKHASCVVVGTFNIYVVQPKLLAEIGVFPTEQPVFVSGDLTQPGIRFDVNAAKWVVRPDRLSVESERADVDCGELVKKTLTALCWTPIMAVGVNLAFTSSGDSETELPANLRLPNHPDATVRTVHVCIPHGGSKINFVLTREADELLLSMNAHTDFSGRKVSQKHLNESVLAVCESFLEQRRVSVEMARRITEAEFVYE